MSENEELAPVVDASAISVFNKDYINTLSIDTFEGKIKAINALNNADSLKDNKKPVKMVDCLQIPGIRKGRSDNQGDSPCINSYIFDADGKVYFTQSEGIARSLKMIAAITPNLGKDAAHDYLVVKVVSKETANGNTIKSLVVDM
jgi:hypothetical protein